MNVLYVAHGHPSQARGGGELAAWRLFKHFSTLYGPTNCGLLAAARSTKSFPPGCEVMGLAANQWLLKPSSNPVIHNTAVNLGVNSSLHQALRYLEPNLIHMHHYLHLGVDLIHALKLWFPQAKFVLTLHDYWGMCAHEGRLLRRSGDLCPGPEVEACINCLASTEAAAYLAIRAVRMKRFFAAIDHFIAPSYFLKQQYQTWGISAKKLSVIENLPPTQAQASHQPEFYSTLRLGYFGQVNQWKGLNIILEAVARALGEGACICLQVHGIDADGISEGVEQANPFHLHCAHWLGQIKAGAVQLNGSYHETELTERLLGVDVLVMGSIWYENSPMVIQEAFCHGLPVLAPKLGGMAEKINHNKNGLLYEAANTSALASLFVQLATDPKLVARLKANARKAGLGLHRAATQHERFYAGCLFNNK